MTVTFFLRSSSMNTRKSLRNLTLPLALLFLASPASLKAQTGSSGALIGTVTDPSGGVVADAQVRVTNEATGETRTVNSNANGSYSLQLLLPDTYRVEFSRTGFKLSVKRGIQINVTETARLDVVLDLGGVQEVVTVTTEAALLQTETSTLGRVTNQTQVANLPLATRNFTQIIGLSAGIAAEVNNATEVGRGSGGADVANGPRAHGSFARDNNFQMNGLPINDLQASGLFTGGIAIPNPDTIQEFKVQTSLYDAAFGRNAGANVNVVTRSGSNNFHGTAFEFLRNDKFNANDFFRNSAGQPRGVLKQNQFGFTLGGPIKRNRVLFFTSYQGTRQRRCRCVAGSSSVFSPALTNDRSRAALGALFAGQRGAIQNQLGGVGPAIAADGSNISPQALALLSRKLPNGQYLIPTPQTVDPARPFNTRGFSAFSERARFDENQYLINIDYLHTERSRFGGRYFQVDGDQTTPLPPNAALGGPVTPGFPQIMKSQYRIFSISHTYTIGPILLNEFQFGFNRMPSQFEQTVPLEWQDVAVSAPSNANPHPVLQVSGSLTLGGNGGGAKLLQKSYIFQDLVTWVRGDHSFRFGGGVTCNQINIRDFHLFGALIFLSWPDLLLGLPAGEEASGGNATTFSNIFSSLDLPIQAERNWRFTDVNAYVQDDYRLNRSLTLNLGLRYERLGAFADTLGRNAGFDVGLLNPNAPAGGTVAGYVVSRDFPGSIPAGVKQLANNFGNRGNGQNTWAPRVGFAWQLPKSFFAATEKMVLRGGYGIYYSRTAGQTAFQSVIGGGPFAQLRQIQGTANGSASFANPFPPEFSLPQFVPYSPTTQLTPRFVAQDLRPPITQQYSVNLQMDLSHDLLLEVAYVGSRATHQLTNQIYNQAQLASPSHPIHGETTNTVANIAQRVPFLGFAPIGLNEIQSQASAWYNGLETSLTRRLSRGLQFLVAYTFSKSLSGAGADTGVSGVNAIPGNQNDRRLNYGQSDFNRPHRLVVSYLYDFPTIKVASRFSRGLLNGWSLTGVTTIQSGQPLTLVGTNTNNAYGINGTGGDRAQLAPGCTYNQLLNSGPMANRLNVYFNTDCILRTTTGAATWNVIGSDGRATDFGNSGVGIVAGPGQRNFDVAVIKRTPLTLLGDAGNIEFRTELFNAFNTPQFAPPNTNVSASTFGVISATSVNPRIIQFAVKLNF